MTNKEKIRGRIENWFNICLKRAKIVDADYWNAKADAYRNVLLAFDDLPEEPVNKELEEAANDYAHDIVHDDVFETFIDGANWQKKQMMKDAVEGEVCLYESYKRTIIAILVDVPKEELGDKVKIIIVKEEQK